MDSEIIIFKGDTIILNQANIHQIFENYFYDETPEILKCLCCKDPIDMTNENKVNKQTTYYDGDYFHRECFFYERYGPYKGYPTPKRGTYLKTKFKK